MFSRFALISFIACSVFLSSNTFAAENTSDASTQLSVCNKAFAEDEANTALDAANKVLAQDKDSRTALLCKGRALNVLGQYQEALAALNAAETLSQIPLEHIIALTLIGNVQKNSKQYSEAQSTYEKSLAISQSEKNNYLERTNLNSLGDTFVASNQLQKALDSYLAGSKLAANDNERADGFERIAATYKLMANYDKAIEYQIKAYLMQEQAGDLDQYANAGLELGAIYTATGNYVNAEKYINKTLKLSRDNGGAYWEAKSEYYLALNKIANQKPADAKPLLLDAQKITSEIGAKGLNEQISSALKTLPK